MKANKPQKIFNTKKRRVNRKYIPVSESISSISILVLIILMVFWVRTQKDNFNPTHRDIAISQLTNNEQPITLYHRPLKRWSESGFSQNNQGSDLAIFPKGMLNNNWQLKKSVKQFDKDNLFEKINGEAERFLRHQFKRLYFLNLIHNATQNEIDIELYDQGGIPGSMGIFSEHRSKDSQVREENGIYYFESSFGAIGRVENYFFRISGLNKNKATRDKIKQVISDLSELSKTEEKIEFGIFIFKDILKISPSDISHKSHNVFQYDFAQDFWFAKPDSQKKARLFVHEGKSPRAVADLFEQLKTELEYEYTVTEQSSMFLLGRHNFLKTYFTMIIQDQYLYGFENAQDFDELAKFMETIKQELTGEK